jgi:hypothetical protein
MIDEDRRRSVLCDAVNLQFRGLHVPGQFNAIALLERNALRALWSEIRENLALPGLDDEAMSENVGHPTGEAGVSTSRAGRRAWRARTVTPAPKAAKRATKCAGDRFPERKGPNCVCLSGGGRLPLGVSDVDMSIGPRCLNESLPTPLPDNPA